MNDWYAPRDGQETPAYPDLDLFTVAELDPAGANVVRDDDGVPIMYSIYLLSVSGAPPERAVVAQLEAALAPREWSLSIASDDELRLSARNEAHTPDAWLALQDLRALKKAGGLSDAASDLVSRLSPHRMAFVGMPAKRGHVGTERQAVAVPLITLVRRPEEQLPSGRRPVVALLDSGIGRHDWMVSDSTDPIWLDAADLGWDAPPVPPEQADFADADPHTHSHAGHGTFVAGLIRQLAPDARLLSMHVMRADGILDEKTVLSALTWLVQRVRVAITEPERFAECFVDVVCLAFGYYEKTPADSAHTVLLRHLLGELGNMGVRVVASAGNHECDTPVFPAALAVLARTETVPETKLISVGALNPNLSRAKYSNFGPWVTHFQVGTALTSAMPFFGHYQLHLEPSAEHDWKNLASGFVTWGGTSFAAAAIAGQLAAVITESDDARTTPEAAHERARHALDRLR